MGMAASSTSFEHRDRIAAGYRLVMERVRAAAARPAAAM
jgi:hypothetical protein